VFDDELPHEEEDAVVEAYCVRCREMVELERPVAVWTRRSVPAMRGECPLCGGSVFRMGRTEAHTHLNRPSAVRVATHTRAKLPQETVYINHAADAVDFAAQLAADLTQLGVACWMHTNENETDDHWAGGVHPSLTECARMILVISAGSASAADVEAAWQFFRAKNKPILIAQTIPLGPPDALRRRPRFDFTGDYRLAFRQLWQALDG